MPYELTSSTYKYMDVLQKIKVFCKKICLIKLLIVFLTKNVLQRVIRKI